MGPDNSLSGFVVANAANPINSPRFVTNKKVKKVYMDALLMWIDIMNQFTSEDLQYKAQVSSAGHLVYMKCDGTAKEMIKREEKRNCLLFERTRRTEKGTARCGLSTTWPRRAHPMSSGRSLTSCPR